MTEEIKYNLLIIDKSGLTPDKISVSALSKEGFSVTTLPDHSEALPRLIELKPDLTRPVSKAELVARMKAILRRRQWACTGG